MNSITMLAAALVISASLVVPTAATGQTYQILTNFNIGFSGGTPAAGLILDQFGNLFGTEFYQVGGPCTFEVFDGCGGVFELTPNGNGTWTATNIYGFQGGSDGGNPLGPLVLDPQGNLYGTTTGCCGSDSTAFELTPQGGTWSERVLFRFSGSYGTYANGLTLHSNKLYGTTATGGPYGDGSAFVLGQFSADNWNALILRQFQDQAQASGPLVFDSQGDAYGTSLDVYPGFGGVYKLSPATVGSGWRETLVYVFQDVPDGNQPYGGVVFDAAGNLYGTTYYGGNSSACFDGCGTVFKLTPQANGTWQETILHNFQGGANDGARPQAGVILDSLGNVYGTTSMGGLSGPDCSDGQTCGVVFRLTPAAGGQWTETILHRFSGTDGAIPMAPLTRDSHGNLYGTTFYGGSFGRGVVFEISH